MRTTHHRTGSRWKVGALAIACALAPTAAAQDAEPESEALRTRVEQIHENPDLRIQGVPIAARRALPAFYERRGFTLAWSAPAARADLLQSGAR